MRLILIFLGISLVSCSSYNLAKRRKLDKKINNVNMLEGVYEVSDTNSFGEVTVYKKEIFASDSNAIKLKSFINDSLILEGKYSGKIKNGYFKFKSKYQKKLIAGPLIWILSDQSEYYGITKENNLVKLSSAGATMFLLIVPIMFDEHDFESIYYKQ